MTCPRELLADCDAHGIRLFAAGDGGLTIDAPQNALTPDLLCRLKAHKGELLSILPPETDALRVDPTDPVSLWQAVLNRLAGDPLFPADVLEKPCGRLTCVGRQTRPQVNCWTVLKPTATDRDGWVLDSIGRWRTRALSEVWDTGTLANAGRELALPAMRPADNGAAITRPDRANTPTNKAHGQCWT